MLICTKNSPSVNKYFWEYQVKYLNQIRQQVMKIRSMICYSFKYRLASATQFSRSPKMTVTSGVTELTQVGQWMWEVQLEYPLQTVS
jgi:hypothetical protein